MLIEKTAAEVMKISDVKGLDPIHVITQDYEPGKGRIWISCFSRAYVGYWGAMGMTTIRNFWLICDAEYLVGSMLSGNRFTKAEESHLQKIVKAVQEAFMKDKLATARAKALGSMKATLEKLCDQTVLIDRVIFLAGALAAGDVVPDDLNDFFDQEDRSTLEKCLGQVPAWVNLNARSHERAEAIFEWLHSSEKLGFLVKFSTPVMQPVLVGEPVSVGGSTFSWSRRTTTWIYAETVDEAIAKGLEWVEQRRAAEEAKALEGGAA